ncbi:MAG: hypothetical protein N4A59_01835 [Marinifilum sp.]|jgi:hypothetical protein|nr:hypothetical protein [Marinifilum sp.]
MPEITHDFAAKVIKISKLKRHRLDFLVEKSKLLSQEGKFVNNPYYTAILHVDLLLWFSVLGN